MLVGLHVPTNFQMYRQKSEKALLGGGAIAPLPPSGYANADNPSYLYKGEISRTFMLISMTEDV